MRMPFIPVFEPEVVAAKVKSLGLVDEEKVPTTSLKNLVIGKTDITSRYNKASEYKDMLYIYMELDEELRKLISTMYCDSKYGNLYSIVLYNCDEEKAIKISSQINSACISHKGGHNGILVEIMGMGRLQVSPFWQDDI